MKKEIEKLLELLYGIHFPITNSKEGKDSIIIHPAVRRQATWINDSAYMNIQIANEVFKVMASEQ